MISYRDYKEIDGALKFRFDAPHLDIREISAVGWQLHKIVNKIAIEAEKLDSVCPE